MNYIKVLRKLQCRQPVSFMLVQQLTLKEKQTIMNLLEVNGYIADNVTAAFYQMDQGEQI